MQKDIKTICFDYDGIYIYSGMDKATMSSDTIFDNNGTVNISTVHNFLKKTHIKGIKKLNIILPNEYYTNKKFTREITSISRKLSFECELNIFSQSEAFAFHLIGKGKRNRRQRVIDIGATIIKVNDFEVSNGKFWHINTSEFKWQNTRSIGSIFEEKGDNFVDSMSFEETKELLDRVHNDILKMESKYYVYRIDYKSNVTYQNLLDKVESWSQEFNSIVGSIKGVDSQLDIWYCGELATWKTFIEKVLHRGTIDNLFTWIDIIESINYGKNYYRQLGNRISFCLNNLNGKKTISLFDVGDQLPIIQKGKALILSKKVRIPLKSSHPLKVELEYDGASHFMTIPLSGIVQNALYKKSNFYYDWIEVCLEWEVDGCNNLIVNFYQNSTLIYSQNVVKLKLN